MALGKGRAAAVTDSDYSALAGELGVHPADLEAIASVESGGFGWFKDGRVKILFEKHWFYKLLSGGERDAAVRAGLARKAWVSPKAGGYKDQTNADSRYRLLSKAIAINEEAAFGSVSIGTFQIMGFNHAACGYSSATAMWSAFCDSEANQLRAFANFLRSKNLVQAIKARDFDTVEKVYNGGGLKGAYAKRMREASDKGRAGKWRTWQPRPVPAPPARVEPVPAPKPVEPVNRVPEPPVAPPEANRGKGIAAIWAAVIAALASGMAYVSNLPCEWLGWFCGG